MTARGLPSVRRLGVLAALLVGVDFLDELGSGIPFVAAPDVQAEFGVSYGRAAGWLLAAIGALGVVLEPPLFLLADRHPRRWFVCGGLAALGAACLLAAWAPTYAVLVVALLVFGGGWRQGLLAAGVAFGVWALLLWRQPFPERNRPAGERALPLRTALAAALRTPGLRVWSVGVLLCGLLDETLVAFGALFLRDHLGADVNTRAAILTAFMAG